VLNRWSVEGLDGAISPTLSTSSGEVMRRLCLVGEGISCHSNVMVGDDIGSGRLEVILLDATRHGGPRELVQAVYDRNTGMSARIQAFLDLIEPRLRL